MSTISGGHNRQCQIPRVSTCSLRLVFFTLTLTSASIRSLPAQDVADVKGSQDHPMFSRVEGSRITSYEQKEFDEYRLVTGQVKGATDATLNEQNSVPLEGKVWKITYKVPKNRSTLEILRSYQAAFTKAAFQTLYQCAGPECGVGLDALLMKRAGYDMIGHPADKRYLAARLARNKEDIYVSVLAIGYAEPTIRLDVVEAKPASSLIGLDAAAMAAGISARGRVALYGIYFDTDRAEVKPESRTTLAEISTLLKQNAKMNLIVVGHTDNSGTLDYNMDLSLRRAQAVVAALISDFDVARDRVEPRGVGFLAPVAPNTSELERAKNRRVELLSR